MTRAFWIWLLLAVGFVLVVEFGAHGDGTYQGTHDFAASNAVVKVATATNPASPPPLSQVQSLVANGANAISGAVVTVTTADGSYTVTGQVAQGISTVTLPLTSMPTLAASNQFTGATNTFKNIVADELILTAGVFKASVLTGDTWGHLVDFHTAYWPGGSWTEYLATTGWVVNAIANLQTHAADTANIASNVLMAAYTGPVNSNLVVVTGSTVPGVNGVYTNVAPRNYRNGGYALNRPGFDPALPWQIDGDVCGCTLYRAGPDAADAVQQGNEYVYIGSWIAIDITTSNDVVPVVSYRWRDTDSILYVPTNAPPEPGVSSLVAYDDRLGHTYWFPFYQLAATLGLVTNNTDVTRLRAAVHGFVLNNTNGAANVQVGSDVRFPVTFWSNVSVIGTQFNTTVINNRVVIDNGTNYLASTHYETQLVAQITTYIVTTNSVTTNTVQTVFDVNGSFTGSNTLFLGSWDFGGATFTNAPWVKSVSGPGITLNNGIATLSTNGWQFGTSGAVTNETDPVWAGTSNTVWTAINQKVPTNRTISVVLNGNTNTVPLSANEVIDLGTVATVTGTISHATSADSAGSVPWTGITGEKSGTWVTNSVTVLGTNLVYSINVTGTWTVVRLTEYPLVQAFAGGTTMSVQFNQQTNSAAYAYSRLQNSTQVSYNTNAVYLSCGGTNQTPAALLGSWQQITVLNGPATGTSSNLAFAIYGYLSSAGTLYIQQAAGNCKTGVLSTFDLTYSYSPSNHTIIVECQP